MSRFALSLSGRIALSLAGGVLIPSCYIFVIAQVEELLPLQFRPALHFPFEWPRSIYFLFVPRGYWSSLFREFPFSALFFIACNVLLYGAITYFLIPALPTFGKRPRPFR